MRKSTLLYIILFAAIISYPQYVVAQVKKGDWLIEGNIGDFNFAKYHSVSSVDSFSTTIKGKTTAFGIYPRGGYFIIDDLAVGATVGLNVNTGKSSQFNTAGIKNHDDKYNSGSFLLAPFLRYYIPSKKDKLRFYTEVGCGVSFDMFYHFNNQYYDTAGTVINEFNTNYPKKNIAVSPELLVGLNYFITNQISINTSLGYKYYKSVKTTSFTNTDVNGVSVTSSDDTYSYQSHQFSWVIGFTYFISKKVKAEKIE